MSTSSVQGPRFDGIPAIRDLPAQESVGVFSGHDSLWVLHHVRMVSKRHGEVVGRPNVRAEASGPKMPFLEFAAG